LRFLRRGFFHGFLRCLLHGCLGRFLHNLLGRPLCSSLASCRTASCATAAARRDGFFHPEVQLLLLAAARLPAVERIDLVGIAAAAEIAAPGVVVIDAV